MSVIAKTEEAIKKFVERGWDLNWEEVKKSNLATFVKDCSIEDIYDHFLNERVLILSE